jgi:3-oxoacyl-[acyl-carrier protein] reductase
MDLGISGRWAIVCASSQGLGRACAEALAAEDVNLVINGRDAGRLDDAAGTMVGTGVQVRPVAADITTGAGREQVLAGCPEPDILVTNNAGPQPGGLLGQAGSYPGLV